MKHSFNVCKQNHEQVPRKLETFVVFYLYKILVYLKTKNEVLLTQSLS